MERAMGIETTSEAWEASILPLHDARSDPVNSTRDSGVRTTAYFTKAGFDSHGYFRAARRSTCPEQQYFHAITQLHSFDVPEGHPRSAQHAPPIRAAGGH